MEIRAYKIQYIFSIANGQTLFVWHRPVSPPGRSAKGRRYGCQAGHNQSLALISYAHLSSYAPSAADEPSGASYDILAPLLPPLH